MVLKEEFNFTECNFLIFLHFTRIPSAKNAKRKNEIAFEVVAYAKWKKVVNTWVCGPGRPRPAGGAVRVVAVTKVRAAGRNIRVPAAPPL